MSNPKIYGWWFCGATLRDGSPIPPDGEWLIYTGVVSMCNSGLHYSPTPAQALEYAPGPILCYVELENVIKTDEDKGVCTRRKIIARMDATEACRYTARMNALSVSHLWNDSDDPDDVVLNWLLTGDASAGASAGASAMASARDSAWASARASAWDSAMASAWDSARDSAWASARASAWDSARASAWASAWDSARASAWDSAWASAWDSARASAWDSARDRFNDLIYECFEDVMK